MKRGEGSGEREKEREREEIHVGAHRSVHKIQLSISAPSSKDVDLHEGGRGGGALTLIVCCAR